MNKCGLALLVVPLISSVAAAVQPITATYYTSTPQSYIGGGETLLLTPPQDGITSGFSFLPNSAYVNTVDIRASDGRFDWWANFVGPNHTQVTVGSYSFTIGWDFQPVGEAGFEFVAENRGDANVYGTFQVLEIERVGDTLTKFAADFIQFEKFGPGQFTQGSIRFNSDIPLTVPEPSAFALAALGTVGLLYSRRLFS